MTRAAAIVATAAIAACSPGVPEKAPVSSDSLHSVASPFRDPTGQPVAMGTLPVRRIVSTMQSATEWIVALGASDLLVARTDFDRQQALASLPSIGGGLEASPEVVAALAPDVVLGWRNRGSADLHRALATFGIPVISMETTDTADMFANLAQIGMLVGRTMLADSLADALRVELRGAAARCGNQLPTESAMVVLWADPPMTAGSGTWMHEILGAACLSNAFADLETPWPTISMEAITLRQPRWIVTSAGERAGQRVEELRGRAGWRDLDAVRDGRVIEVPGDLFARAGPTLARTVAALVAGRAR